MERMLSRGKRHQARRSKQPAIDRGAWSWRDLASPTVHEIIFHFLKSLQSLRDQPQRLRSLFFAKGWLWRFRFGLFALLGLLLLSLVISNSYLASVDSTAPPLATGRRFTAATDYLSRVERLLDALAAETWPPATENTPNQTRAEPSDQARPQGAGTSAALAENAAKQIPVELADQARAQTVSLLQQEPLDSRALRILGQLADATADQAEAAALMQAAARRSLQETRALGWVMAERFRQGDFEKTAYYADALLRTRPQLVPQVTPVLARMAENKDAISVLENRLAQNPPWRRAFLYALPTTVSDARTPLNLLLNLRETSTPPVAADIHSYIAFLIAHKFYELAYYAWLQFLAPNELNNVGLLYNGSFEKEPSKLPFDWVIGSGSGVTIDIVSPPDDQTQKALYIEFGYGRVDFGGVTEMVVLPAGTYQLSGKYKGELIGRRGLLWRISCVDGRRLGESDMILGAKPEWQQFNVAFSIPDRDCRAQRISLVLDSRSASEQFVTGSIWYDDLAISRDQSAIAPRFEAGKE